MEMTDQQREERIAALNEQIANIYYQGRIDMAYEATQKRDGLVIGRSQKQIKRMEKEKGLA